MRAWVVHEPGPMATRPLRLLDRPVPEPGPAELLIRVLRCGVCRTDLHLAEGDLLPRRPDVVPAHEVAGEVVRAGRCATRFTAGDPVGGACRAGAGGPLPSSRRATQHPSPPPG